jgi:hypothetical protein
MKALLKITISLKSIPPWALERPIHSQQIQWIMDSFFWCPHQDHFCIIPLISVHKVNGSWKTLILLVRIAWITAFNKISFPTYERNLNFQLCKRFHTLSFMILKAYDLDFPISVGSPRYLSYLCVAWSPDNRSISFLPFGDDGGFILVELLTRCNFMSPTTSSTCTAP